jgi:PAT family beta-lactamase induction signal transducer AmpG
MNNNLRSNTVALFFLGISSGLPILLVFGTLSVWLREAGIERATIGFLSWAGLSYGFKFIWAPIVDSLNIPFLTQRFGRRRSWMLISQGAVIVALIWMSLWDPQQTHLNFVFLAAGAVLLGFASATQDIVIDAYRIDIAPGNQQALLAGVAIAGYRIGMLFAGAGALEISAWAGEENIYDFQSWQVAYLCMSGFMAIGILTTLLIKEPHVTIFRTPITSQLRLFLHFLLLVTAFVFSFIALGSVLSYFKSDIAFFNLLISAIRLAFSMLIAVVAGSMLTRAGLLSKQEFREVYISPFVDFFSRYGKLALWLLLVICFYRTSDIVMGVMAKVFYTDMGYSKIQISRISFVFGTIVSLIGGIFGGLLAIRYGVIKILFIGAIVASLSNLIFIYLANLPGPSSIALGFAIVGDNLSGGLAGGAAVAFLSTLVSKQFSATQYAAFSSITLLFPKLLAGYSGQIVDFAGYQSFFAITALMGIPVIILILLIWKPYLNLMSIK